MTELAGRCKEYKQATDNFVNWLCGQVPPPCQIVDDILQKAKGIVERGISIPGHIYHDLCTCIRVRKEVHQMYVRRLATKTEDNRRHKYMISVLQAAKESLRETRGQEASAQTPENPAENDLEFLNSFDLLAQSDSEPEELSDELRDIEPSKEGMLVRITSADILGIVKSATSETYIVCCHGKAYEVDVDDVQLVLEEELREFFGETLSFQAACFLLDLEEVQQEIVAVWEAYAGKKCDLLTAAATTNFAVRFASSLAHGLELLHKELFSIERVVVAAYLLHVVQWVQQEVRSSFATALDLVTGLVFGDPGETKVSYAPHGTILKMARLGLHDGNELQRAREILCCHKISIVQADQIIDVVAESCCRSDLPNPLCLPPVLNDDFLMGSDGFIHTSGFLLRLSNAGLLKPPKMWNFLKPDFFGPQWDEEQNPAHGTSELTSYAGAVIPALLWYAFYELRTSPTQQLQVPDLKFDTLMPLWPLLQEAMSKRAATLPLAFALHALLLSTAKVNGDRRCKRIAVTCRACFEKLASQIARDEKFYDHTAAAHNLAMGKLWVDENQKRLLSTFSDHAEDKYLASIGCLQRDYSLLLNPWMAGQQQLVAVLAVAIGFGASIIDSRGQIRFVLHLYNALRCAEVIQPLEVLDWLMIVFASSKTIWHAGRPDTDFMQHWFLSVGMAISQERGSALRRQRKLVPIEPENLSPAYRRAAADDFSDLSGRCRSLKQILQALKSSFDGDVLIRNNLMALGAHFRTLPEALVDRLHLHGEVVEEQTRPERRQRRPKDSKRKEEAQTTDRLDAIYGLLASKILFQCDRPETVEAMAKKPGYKAPAASKMTRWRLPTEKPELQDAAEVLTTHVAALKSASYTLPG